MEIKNSALLLADSEFSMASEIKSALKDRGYELIYINSFESFVDHVVLAKDCLIFIDKKRGRYLNIIKSLVEKCTFFKEHLVVYLTDETGFSGKALVNGNVMAFHYNEIVSNLGSIIRKSEVLKNLPTSFEEREAVVSVVTELLINCGVSPKYVGFDYIVQIVLMSMGSNFVLNKLQKDVYPKISLMFGVPACNIERNIRSIVGYASRSGKFKKLILEILPSIPENLTTKTFLSLVVLYTEAKVGGKLIEIRQKCNK